MNKYRIHMYTYKHLGDYTALTNALYNAKQAYPEYEFCVDFRGYTQYSDLFLNNPLVSQRSDLPNWDMHVHYGTRSEEIHGSNGNFLEGFHSIALKSFGYLHNYPCEYPMIKKTPDFYILPDEYDKYPIPYKDYCILNANCQTSSDVKGYPYWQEVVDMCPDIQFLQIGGDPRDITTKIKNTVDLRGKTTVRQLLLLASRAKYILSGPSGIVHIGQAFPDVHKFVVIGARESENLWKYENTTVFGSSCESYGGCTGCMKRHFGPGQCDKYCVSDTNQKFAQCMSNISPEQIAEELHKVV